MYSKIVTKLALCILLLLVVSCKSLQTVEFEKPVDTQTKSITIQQQQIYTLDDLGVYASNQFDGARLNGFQKLNDSTAIVIIKPENAPINNSAYYAFKTWSKSPKPFYFRFQYPDGYRHRYIPKLKTASNWVALDSTRIFNNDTTVTIKLDLNKQPLTIAAQELQTSLDVANWYTDLIKEKDYVKFKNFGKSTLGKDLPVLDIYHGTKENKPIIVLLTRQHPPEVTGFLAFKEFLSTILSNSELATDFLNRFRVLAFPIMNPDGVDLGHWRHNAGGVDTNRDWSEYRQPEVRQTVRYITKQLKKNKTKLILGLDFHSTYEDVFYTNKIRETTALPTFIEDWFEALEKNIPGYKVNEKAANSTSPVSKGWFLYGHDAVGITYEIGDKTPRDRIKLVGKVTAEQMMQILLK